MAKNQKLLKSATKTESDTKAHVTSADKGGARGGSKLTVLTTVAQ